MSDDDTVEDTFEVEMDWLPARALAGLGTPTQAGSYGVEAHQARHGDIPLGPAVHGTFYEDGSLNQDKMHSWLAKEQTETPAMLKDDEDKPDIQGWTYIADYSFHPLTPNHSGPRSYYIHARIRHDYSIQFGVFASVYQGTSECPYALARLSRYEGEGTLPARAQVLHGDLRPAFRIAGKAESEAMMMKEGKLIIAACPKSLGVLMNVGMGKLAVSYGETTTHRSITYYGHIWTYWGTIVDNTLYIVGLPLYTGSDKGAYRCAIGGEETTYRVSLPPTNYDARAGSGNFMAAAKLLWGHRSGVGFERTTHMVDAVLEKYGDWSTPAVLCRRALAKVSPSLSEGEYEVTQLCHGDIGDSLTLYSIYGGVYADKEGGLKAYNSDNVYHAHLGDGSTFYSSGTSGYIPTKTRCNLDGWVRYAAQAAYCINYGPSYQIRLSSPYHPYGYIPDEGGEGYKLLAQADARVTIPKEPDEEEEEEDDKNGGWGGGGGGGGSGGGEDDDDDPSGSGAEDWGDIGIWIESGDGVTSTSHREDKENHIGYVFSISVSKTFKVTDNLHYNVALRCSVADGNSYSVDDDTSVTMWYYLTGQIATITVCNITSMSWGGGSWNSNSHPASVTTFEQTTTRPGYAKAYFPKQHVNSSVDVSSYKDSNIAQLVSTGRTRKINTQVWYTDSEGRRRFKRVKATMKCYKFTLQQGTIKEILKNTLRRQLWPEICEVKPTSVKGTGGGSAGPPVVTSNGADASAIPLPIQGETDVKGAFKMEVQGALDAIYANFYVQNGTTGWYEGTLDNRQSTSISGSFTVVAPYRAF